MTQNSEPEGQQTSNSKQRDPIIQRWLEKLFVALKAWFHRRVQARLFVAILWMITAALVVFAIGWLFIGYFLNGSWTWELYSEETKRMDAVRIILTMVAGVGGIALLTISYRKQRGVEESNFMNRLENAARQLGAPEPSVQFAGIYALASLADDETLPERKQQCVNVLCGYLRLPYASSENPSLLREVVEKHTWTDGRRSVEETHTHQLRPADKEVRLTIIRTITDHLQNDSNHPWTGLKFDFTGATFDGGDFSKALFSGEVNFIGAHFKGGTVNFAGAHFNGGTVNFAGAHFNGGTVNFAGAHFESGTVNFEDARFESGTVNFEDAHFNGGTVNFAGAHFNGGTVDFGFAHFDGRTVNFADAHFSGGTVNFKYAHFNGGTVNFEGAHFNGGTVDFGFATFDGGTVNFAGAHFSGGTVNFKYARFESEYFDVGTVSFAFARFESGTVNFTFARFESGTVNFESAVFGGGTVNFESATFDGGAVSFRGGGFGGGTVNFEYAHFTHGSVNFEDARFESGTVNFESATFDGGIVSFRSSHFNGGTMHFQFAWFIEGEVDFQTFKVKETATLDFTNPLAWAKPPRVSWGAGEPPLGVEPRSWPPALYKE